MPAAYHVLTIEQGGTYTKMLSVKLGGAALALAGYTALMQIRQNVSSPAPIIELSTENGRIIIDADAGTLTLSIPAEETATIRVPADRSGFPLQATYVYDLMLIAADGTVRPLMRGDVKVIARVSR